jgi:hypothetical protein
MLLCIVLAGIVTPALAANGQRYGYITVETMQIRFDNANALIHLNYSVDEVTRFIFFLLGDQDLKNKLIAILNYDDVQVKNLNLTQADFVVDNASYSYGHGVYWFPSHDFNVVIPVLTIQSPQAIRNLAMTKRFPEGMGYFGNVTPDATQQVTP